MYEPSPRAADLKERVLAFMDRYVYPNEARFFDEVSAGDRWQPAPIVEELKAKARAEGLWNLFADSHRERVRACQLLVSGRPVRSGAASGTRRAAFRAKWARAGTRPRRHGVAPGRSRSAGGVEVEAGLAGWVAGWRSR